MKTGNNIFNVVFATLLVGMLFTTVSADVDYGDGSGAIDLNHAGMVNVKTAIDLKADQADLDTVNAAVALKANSADVYTKAEADAADDVGSGVSTSAEVVDVFDSGSCDGYLKSDGSCDTPSGTVTLATDLSGDETDEAPSVEAVNDGLDGKQPLDADLTAVAGGTYNNIISPTCVEDAETNCIASGKEISDAIDAISISGVPHVASGYPADGAVNWNTTDKKFYARTGDTVYSSAAMTLAATLYSATVTITDTPATGSLWTMNGESSAVTKTWTDLPSATETLTFTPDTTETSACTGDVTGTTPTYTLTGDTIACTVSAGGSTYAYFDETYEVVGSDETWVTTSGKLGDVDENNTVSPISGLQSVLLDGVAGSQEEVAATATPVSEGYFALKFNNTGGFVSTDYFYTLADSSDNTIAQFRIFNNGTQIYTYYWHNGARVTGAAETIDTISGNTVYLGVYYKAGDGTAEYKFWLSTTELGASWGVADQEYTGKISTTEITQVKIARGTNNTALAYRFDDLTGAATAVTR